MKYFSLQLSLAMLLVAASACGAVRPVIQPTDSTRVEVRYETRTVHDTAYVELPVIVERVATLDTLSLLENDYAKSDAIVSAGSLSHSLETKPVKLLSAIHQLVILQAISDQRIKSIACHLHLQTDRTDSQQSQAK